MLPSVKKKQEKSINFCLSICVDNLVWFTWLIAHKVVGILLTQLHCIVAISVTNV